MDVKPVWSKYISPSPAHIRRDGAWTLKTPQDVTLAKVYIPRDTVDGFDPEGAIRMLECGTALVATLRNLATALREAQVPGTVLLVARADELLAIADKREGTPAAPKIATTLPDAPDEEGDDDDDLEDDDDED